MKKLLKILLSVILAFVLICGIFAVANKLNEKPMHEYIDTFGAVEYENQLVPEYDENGVAYFTTDGDFKIMHLTDVHLGGSIISIAKDKKAINAIAAMINEEKPDLVVVTGDISFAVPWGGTINNRYAHEMFGHIMENLGVYWTVSFGNHDSEIYNYYNRSQVAEMYESEELEHCLFNRGPESIWGECNHIINVRDSRGLVTQSIVMMDTNSYTDEDPLGTNWIYDNIHADQIEWYENSIIGLGEYNKAIIDSLPDDQKPENPDDYTTVKSLLFIHIPLMEVRDAYNEYLDAGEQDTDDVKYLGGKVDESAPYVYCSEEEEQMFETMLELGSTKAMFYGHDHLNNIRLNYKGIILSYGYSVDYFAYWQIDKQGSQRGCTVITCSPDTSFEIVHENYYQDKYQPLYEKEVVDMTK
ncbi:MAG: metallophosphoesterase [Clostridia bacterium]|nr:metallophosphoesterase [Clostridia bacterium]